MSNLQNTIYDERMEDLRQEREQAEQEAIVDDPEEMEIRGQFKTAPIRQDVPIMDFLDSTHAFIFNNIRKI